MYYDNKQSFYINQYGPVVLVVVFSLLLIGSGVYIYLKSGASVNSLNNIVAQSELKNDTTTTEPTTTNSGDTTIDVVKNLPKDIENLNALEKKEVSVVAVTTYGSVIVKYGEENFEVYLIGADFSDSKDETIVKMRNELTNKNVQIAFDTSKTEAARYYTYMYLNNNLYNEELLKTGLVKLRVERTNVNLLDKLLAAQLQAKNKDLGIWAN